MDKFLLISRAVLMLSPALGSGESGQVWQYTPASPVFWRQKQEDHQFKNSPQLYNKLRATLGYMRPHSLNRDTGGGERNRSLTDRSLKENASALEEDSMMASLYHVIPSVRNHSHTST